MSVSEKGQWWKSAFDTTKRIVTPYSRVQKKAKIAKGKVLTPHTPDTKEVTEIIKGPKCRVVKGQGHKKVDVKNLSVSKKGNYGKSPSLKRSKNVQQKRTTNDQDNNTIKVKVLDVHQVRSATGNKNIV